MAVLKNVTIADDLQVSGSHNAIPVGTTTEYTGITAPPGWLLCDGSYVDNIVYSDLYNVIGTMFGSGSGTFRLPIFDNRIPIGWKSGGTALGGTGGVFGNHTHLAPDHNHAISPHNHSIPTHNHTYEHNHTISHYHTQSHSHLFTHNHTISHSHANSTSSNSTTSVSRGVGSLNTTYADHNHTVNTTEMSNNYCANSTSYTGSNSTNTDATNTANSSNSTPVSDNSAAGNVVNNTAGNTSNNQITSGDTDSEAPYLTLFFIIKY